MKNISGAEDEGRLNLELKISIILPIFYTVLAFITGLLILNYPLPIFGGVRFTEDFWYAIFFKLTFFLIIPLYWLRLQNYTFRDLFPNFNLNARTALTLIISFMLGMILNLIGWLSREIRAVSQEIPASEFYFRLLLAILFAYLVAGIPEEIIFRWFIQTRFEQKMNPYLALVLSSILFTMWHIPSRFLLGDSSDGTAGDFFSILLHTGLPVFIISLLIGFAWYKKRSLMHIIVFHGAVDIIPIFGSFLGIEV